MTDTEKVREELANLEEDATEVTEPAHLLDDLENNSSSSGEVLDLFAEDTRLKRRCCFKARKSDSGSQFQNIEAAKGDFYWRNYIPDKIPEDAVNIGDGEYIGQVNYYENLLPVVIFPKENTAVGERAGKRVFKENIKILCSPDSKKFYWQAVDFDKPNVNTMKNVVKGGYQDGYDLYIGKGSEQYQCPQTKIGKVVPMTNVSCKGLQVWGDYDQCIVMRKFQILKYGSPAAAPKDPVLSGFYWRDYTPDQIPDDAVEGADGKYIGQISCGGDMPAAIYPNGNIAVLERNGKRTPLVENIKIMCSADRNKFHWELIDLKETEKGPVKNAVVGGYQDGFYLFVGRISHEGEWKIGRVNLSDTIGPLGLYVWDEDDKLMRVEKFEILKYDEKRISDK